MKWMLTLCCCYAQYHSPGGGSGKSFYPWLFRGALSAHLPNLITPGSGVPRVLFNNHHDRGDMHHSL